MLARLESRGLTADNPPPSPAPARPVSWPVIVRRHARPLAAAAAFSVFINLLMLAAPLYMLQVYDRVLGSRSLETLTLLTAITLGALAALAWLDAIRMQLLAGAALRIEAAATAPLLRRGLQRPGTSGPAHAQGLRDLRAIRQFLSGSGCIACIDIGWAPLFVALIALFHPLLGTLALAGVSVLLALAWLDDRLSRRAIERSAEATRRTGQLADEALANAEIVRALGLHAAIERRTLDASTRAGVQTLRATRTMSRLLAWSKGLRQVLQVAMLALGATLVIGQHVSPGVMIAATVLLSRAMAPIEAALASWRPMVEARAAWRRLAALLPASDEPSPLALPAPRGELALQGVTLALEPGAAVIKGVSFTLAAGEQMGIVGPSGAGKTMLGRLLVGALHPSAGHVRLDGADLRQWDACALGPHIGYLPQEVQLFDGTVAQNIGRLGDVQRDAQRIVEAATAAGVHEALLRLPQGYDTPVGSAGRRLSAGQRQLVGLARALFGAPALVVLDEPDANLDADGEQCLHAALARLRERGATVVIITHRPSLLRATDRILVLHGGAVAEFGARDAVLRRFARVSAVAPLHAASAAGA